MARPTEYREALMAAAERATYTNSPVDPNPDEMKFLVKTHLHGEKAYEEYYRDRNGRFWRYVASGLGHGEWQYEEI